MAHELNTLTDFWAWNHNNPPETPLESFSLLFSEKYDHIHTFVGVVDYFHTAYKKLHHVHYSPTGFNEVEFALDRYDRFYKLMYHEYINTNKRRSTDLLSIYERLQNIIYYHFIGITPIELPDRRWSDLLNNILFRFYPKMSRYSDGVIRCHEYPIHSMDSEPIHPYFITNYDEEGEDSDDE